MPYSMSRQVRELVRAGCESKVFPPPKDSKRFRKGLLAAQKRIGFDPYGNVQRQCEYAIALAAECGASRLVSLSAGYK